MSYGCVNGNNESHWSNEYGTHRLLDEILAPCIANVKAKLDLPVDQKSLVICTLEYLKLNRPTQ